MRGSNERRTALVAVALGMIVATGTAAAAPVDVLRATDGQRECVAPLADGATFHYRYIQSMYEMPVIEDLVRRGERIAIVRIHSPELRAVEYYRWDSAIRPEGTWFVQEAPPYSTAAMVIRVSPPYAQRIDGPGWACDLEALFPGEIVTVDTGTRPAAATLIR
jgi:hypothetical protein